MDNVVFKPMICTKAAWDISKEFMPYIPKGSIIDTLWSSNSGATVGTEYTMNGNINDYDVVVLKVSDPGDVSQFSSYEQYPFVVSMIGADEQLNCLGYGFRYFTVSIHGNTFTVSRAGTSGESDQFIPILWEIVGIKFAQVSGSGGNNYSETELLDNQIIGDNITNISLTDNINNYNQLVFYFGVHVVGADQGFIKAVPVSLFNTTDVVIIDGYAYADSTNYSLHYSLRKLTDTTLSVVQMNKKSWNETATIFSIKGIKFGTGTSNNTGISIKTLKYTGNGATSKAITFPTTPTLILKISGPGQSVAYMDALNITWGVDTVYYTRYNGTGEWSYENGTITYEGNTMTLTSTTSSPSAVFNNTDREYTVTYM